MLFDSINYWGVLAGGVVAMIVGSIWYARPVLGNVWMKEIGMTEETMGSPGLAMTLVIPVSLLHAFGLAIVIQWVGPDLDGGGGTGIGAFVGFVTWLCFSFTTQTAQKLFSNTSVKLLAINAGQNLVAYVAMGAIVGWFQF